MFLDYFTIGLNHILDLEGLDHFYFIISFCLRYNLKQWKTVLKLVTAFTLGHSLTLVLASLNLIQFNLKLVETLITVTILLTCIKNYFDLRTLKAEKKGTVTNYILVTFFGLIHGMGFSSFIKNMLFDGEDFLSTLIGFNLGIEAAQLIIVILFLIVMHFLNRYIKNTRLLKIIINSIILCLVIQLLF